mgnify:CR=1 FL=1
MARGQTTEIVRYPDGSVKARGTRIGGELHGPWKFYRLDGSLMRAGRFDQGRQVGVWCTYRRDGSLVKRTDFGSTPGFSVYRLKAVAPACTWNISLVGTKSG